MQCAPSRRVKMGPFNFVVFTPAVDLCHAGTLSCAKRSLAMKKIPAMATSKSSVDCLHCLLRRKKVFRELEEDELQFVSKFKIGELDVDAQSSVLIEQQAMPHVYIVLEGVLYRHRTLQDGSRQILNFSMSGDIVGLQLAMMGEIHHSVTALTQAKLCVFERSQFHTLFMGHPDLANSVSWIAATQET